MTEEQIARLGDELKQALADERAALVDAVVGLDRGLAEALSRTDALAEKLAGVTMALVQADAGILERLDRLERFAQTFAPGGQYEDTLRVLREGLIAEQRYVGHLEPKRKRRSLLSRVTRRKSPHQGAVPEGDE